MERIPAALDGERVDRTVALLTGRPRSEVNDLIDAGSVRVAGRAVRSHSRRMHTGERLEVDLPDAPEVVAGLVADHDVVIPLVHVDDDLIVVDKPAGLVVHPGAGRRDGTLIQGLLSRFPDLVAAGSSDDDADRPGIVHRLDRGTSGLLVVARTAEARRDLSSQLAARTVERRYAAVASGSLESDEGLVDAPIGRHPSDPSRRAVRTGGREARTRYRVVARAPTGGATLLECKLETGRTHQIRVHLEAIGHPVYGDVRYGAPPLPAGDTSGQRPWLHARTLAFDHPRTGERLAYTSPVPEDLRAAAVALGLDVDTVTPRSDH